MNEMFFLCLTRTSLQKLITKLNVNRQNDAVKKNDIFVDGNLDIHCDVLR